MRAFGRTHTQGGGANMQQFTRIALNRSSLRVPHSVLRPGTFFYLSQLICGSCAGVLTQDSESNISAHCWDVLKVEPVFLSSLWASPPLLFSAEILV